MQLFLAFLATLFLFVSFLEGSNIVIHGKDPWNIHKPVINHHRNHTSTIRPSTASGSNSSHVHSQTIRPSILAHSNNHTSTTHAPLPTIPHHVTPRVHPTIHPNPTHHIIPHTIPPHLRVKRGFFKKLGKSIEKGFHKVRDAALPALGAAAGAAIIG